MAAKFHQFSARTLAGAGLLYAALLSTVAITVVYIIAVAGLSIGVDYLWIKAFAWSLILALAYGRVGISEWRGLALPYFYS